MLRLLTHLTFLKSNTSQVFSFVKSLTFLFSCLFFLSSCTDDAKAPKLSNTQKPLHMDECKRTNLDLRNLKAQAVRDFISCINGKNNAVKPYYDFINKSLSDKDLQELLNMYNRHMVKEYRFRKILDYVDMLHKNGMMVDIYRSLAVVAKTESLPKMLPVLARFYENRNDGDGTQGDQAIVYINQYIIDLIRRDLLTDSFVSMAKILNSPRARIAAQLISRPSRSLLGSDQIVDILADVVYRSISTREFHELAVYFSDPKNYDTLQAIFKNSDGQIAGISSLAETLVKGASNNGQSPLTDIVLLLQKMFQKVECFRSEQAAGRNMQSLFDVVVNETKSFSNVQQVEEFYLWKAPLLAQSLKQACNIDASFFKYYPSLMGIMQDGYASHFNSLVSESLNSNRIEYFKRLLRSPELQSMAAPIENMLYKGALPYLLRAFEKDIQKQDYQNIAVLGELLMIEDLEPDALLKWLKNNLENSQYLNLALHTVEEKQLSLYHFLRYVDNEAKQNLAFDNLAIELRKTIAAQDFENAPEYQVLPFFQKIFSPNPKFRNDLKNLASAILEAWQVDKHGWGDLIGSFAEIATYSKDRPMQDFIKDLLSDKEFVTAVNPILFKMFEDPLFAEAVKFTGELADRGELERILNFLVSLSRGIDGPGLGTEPYKYKFEKFRGKLSDYNENFSYTPIKPNANYSNCRSINSNLYDPKNTELLQFLKCLKDVGVNDELYSIGQNMSQIQLSSGNSALGELSRMIGVYFVNNANTAKILDQFERSYDQNNLNSILSFVQMGIDPPYELISKMQKFLPSFLNSQYMSPVLAQVGDLLKDPEFPAGVLAVSRAYRMSRDPSFAANASYKMPLENSEVLWQQAWSMRRDLDYTGFENMPNAEEAVRASFIRAQSEYSLRQDTYYYRQAAYPYPGQSINEREQFYLTRLNTLLDLALRPGNLEAIFKALKRLERDNFDYTGFFAWLVGETRLIKYYIGSSKNPDIKIVTPLDQLELLVQNANISVAQAIPALGVDHVGTHFQLEIAKAQNQQILSQNLKTLKSEMALGISYARLFSSRQKLNHLLNIEQNFNVLVEANDKNYLKFLKYIYEELLKVTPENDRDRQDPIRNHMGLAHYACDMAFLSQLSPSLSNIFSQKADDKLVKILNFVVKTTSEADIARIRQILVKLKTTKWNNISAQDYLFRKLHAESQTSSSFDFSKTNLFHILYFSSQNLDSLKNILLILEEAFKNPELTFAAVDFVFDELKQDGPSYDFLYSWEYLDSKDKKAMRNFIKHIFADTTTGSNVNLPMAYLLMQNFKLNYDQHSADFSKFWQSAKSFVNSSNFSDLNLSYHFEQIYADSKYNSALEQSLSQMLKNPNERELVLELLRKTAEKNQWDNIAKQISLAIKNKKVDELIKLLKRNLPKAQTPH